jgi:NAD(P)H dehydrogenase (quinone)
MNYGDLFELCPKVLIIYDSNTGNTERIAEAVAEGVEQVSGVTVEIKRTENVKSEDVISADGYAFGSPSHFSVMSGKMLTLLTNLYSIRDKMAGKPMCVFTTGTGGQVITLENIDRIIGVFNPTFIKPGIVIETIPDRANPWEVDEAQAKNLGRKLAQATKKP